MFDASSSIISTIISKDDNKEIANVEFVDYFSGNRELIVYDASRISQV